MSVAALDNSNTSIKSLASHFPVLDKLGLCLLKLMMPKVALTTIFASKPRQIPIGVGANAAIFQWGLGHEFQRSPSLHFKDF